MLSISPVSLRNSVTTIAVQYSLCSLSFAMDCKFVASKNTVWVFTTVWTILAVCLPSSRQIVFTEFLNIQPSTLNTSFFSFSLVCSVGSLIWRAREAHQCSGVSFSSLKSKRPYFWHFNVFKYIISFKYFGLLKSSFDMTLANYWCVVGDCPQPHSLWVHS